MTQSPETPLAPAYATTAPGAPPASTSETIDIHLRPRRVIFGVASLLFFLSGFTGLVYEVVWFKKFAQVWGSSTLAVAAVIGSFLLGLGIGAQLIGRISGRFSYPLQWYGIAEILIGALALIIPYEMLWLLDSSTGLSRALADSPLLLYLSRLGLTFLVIGPPCILMGGTLPLMVKQLTTSTVGLRQSTGWLYAVNTIGAATGCYMAGFHLLPSFGLRNTNTGTALLNFAIGAVAIVVTRAFLGKAEPEVDQEDEHEVEELLETTEHSLFSKSPIILYSTVSITGVLALVLQIVWTRQLALILGGTTYAFTAVLFVVLVGIALGSFAFRLWSAVPRQLEYAPVVMLPILIVSTVIGQAYLHEITNGIGMLRPLRETQVVNAVLCVIASSMIEFVPAVVMGFLFPFFVHLTRRRAKEAGLAVGNIYAWNTVGSILGASLTSYLIVPRIGSTNTIIAALFLYLLAFIVLYPLTGLFAKAGCLLLSVLLAWVIVWGVERPNPLVTNAGAYLYGYERIKRVHTEDELLMYEEGPSCNVLVSRFNGNVYLRVNGKVDATSHGDMRTQLGSAVFPRILRPEASDVLVIGFGSGVTAGASLLVPGTRVVCAELEPAVAKASKFFHSVNFAPEKDPDYRLVLDDGRNYMQATDQKFDIIISEPSNPWIAGIAALFTTEFYEAARDHLKPGGVVLQWIQCYDFTISQWALIARTVTDVFPHYGLIRIDGSDTLLIASMEPLVADGPKMNRAQQILDGSPELQQAVIQHFGHADVRNLLLENWLMNETAVRSVIALDDSDALNTDLNMLLEYEAPKRLFAQDNITLEVGSKILGATDPTWFRTLYEGYGGTTEQLLGLWTLSQLYQDTGQPQIAREAVGLACEIDPSHALFAAEREILDVRVGKAPFAGEKIEIIGSLSPAQANRAGVRLWEMQAYAGAARVFQRMLQDNPETASTWLNLAVNLDKLDQVEQADEAYVRAVQLDPLGQPFTEYQSFLQRRGRQASPRLPQMSGGGN